MKKGLLINPWGNLIDAMKVKIIEKEKKREKAANKKKLDVDVETVQIEDARPDVDEEPRDKKRKLDAAEASMKDPFDESVTMHFPHGASLIMNPKDHLEEARKLVLPEDKKYIKRMNMWEIQERTLAHLIEAFQSTVVIDEMCTETLVRNKSLKKQMTSIKSEHAHKVEEMEEKIKEMKRKIESLESLEVVNLSLERSVAEANEEIQKLKAEKDAIEFEKNELLESVKDAQTLGALAMEDHLMKEFLRHRGAEWNPEAKIKAFEEYMRERESSGGEKEGNGEEEEEEEEKGEDDEEEDGDDGEEVIPSNEDDDSGDQTNA